MWRHSWWPQKTCSCNPWIKPKFSQLFCILLSSFYFQHHSANLNYAEKIPLPMQNLIIKRHIIYSFLINSCSKLEQFQQQFYRTYLTGSLYLPDKIPLQIQIFIVLGRLDQLCIIIKIMIYPPPPTKNPPPPCKLVIWKWWKEPFGEKTSIISLWGS